MRRQPFSITFRFVTSGRRSDAGRRVWAAIMVASFLVASGCRTVLPQQYEYDEQFDISLDGTATVYVNGSIPALVALRGIDLDTIEAEDVSEAAERLALGDDLDDETREELGVDNIVGPLEAGIGGGLDEQEEARLGVTDEEIAEKAEEIARHAHRRLPRE